LLAEAGVDEAHAVRQPLDDGLGARISDAVFRAFPA